MVGSRIEIVFTQNLKSMLIKLYLASKNRYLSVF